jgi:hypothetical protein
VHVEVAIRTGGLDGLDGGAAPTGLGIAAWQTSSTTDASDPYNCNFVFFASPSEAWVEAQDPKVNPVGTYRLLRYPVTGQWGQWNIDLTTRGDNAITLSMTLDGAPALDPPGVAPCRMDAAFTFAPGLYFRTGPAEARYDNVRIDLK